MRPDSGRPSTAPALALVLALAFSTPGRARADAPGPADVGTPAPWQVLQRDAAGKARIRPDGAAEGRVRVVRWAHGGPPIDPRSLAVDDPVGERLDDGTIELPAGGPYLALVEADDDRKSPTTFGPFFVGDLWVLAGQSNMEGYGDLVDVAPPHPRVGLLGMDGKWAQAKEPLHWLVDSPDPVHSGDPATRERRAEEQRRFRPKGAGLGLPFASALSEAAGVPIGLVACAHGGTSMAQWDPARKSEGGESLYGSMLRQVDLAGGRVRGILWYQGESDAMGPPAVFDAYGETFERFIGAVRSDLGSPDLPFLYVQIGRFVREGDSAGWDAVQEAQRRLVDAVPNAAVVAAVDLDLDDLIHVGTHGLKRLGRRLALVAGREVYGLAGASTPTLARVSRPTDRSVVVEFRGVNRNADAPLGLAPRRHIAGFSNRDADGKPLPLIYEAAAGTAGDSVVLKLVGPAPPGAQLWYGHGLDPYCNLVDGLDMAVPAFGPIPLDGAK